MKQQGIWAIERGKVARPTRLQEIARGLQTTVEYLLGETDDATPAKSEVRVADVELPQVGQMPKSIPVLGTAAGSDHKHGSFQLSTEVVDYVRRPPALANATDAYAIFVEGSSMEPRFTPGELVYVNPRRPAGPGDYVVIQELVADHDYRAFVKQLVRRTAEWVITEQLNPKGEVRFKNTTGLRVHRVIPLAELLGI